MAFENIHDLGEVMLRCPHRNDRGTTFQAAIVDGCVMLILGLAAEQACPETLLVNRGSRGGARCTCRHLGVLADGA
jgi:hypothetical protein